MGIVQPHEGLSVAEQEYLIELHAREEGVEINGFVGADDILLPHEPATRKLMESISNRETRSIVFVDQIEDKMPIGLTRHCRECGCKVLIVNRHKFGLRAA